MLLFSWKSTLPSLLASVLAFGPMSALVVAALPANAATPSAAPAPQAGGAVCYRNDAGFLVSGPEGWSDDPAAAKNLGVCALFLPKGHTFDDAPVVIYPRTGDLAPEQTLEDAAKAQDELTLNTWRAAGLSPLPSVRPGETYASPSGHSFVIHYFDDGPHPNVAEAAAYLIHNDVILTVVLSAYDAASRDAAMPAFKAMLDNIVTMSIEYE